MHMATNIVLALNILRFHFVYPDSPKYIRSMVSNPDNLTEQSHHKSNTEIVSLQIIFSESEGR